MSRSQNDCKVYVGDLGNNGDQAELEDAFSYYGPLKSVWVARQPAGFAFIEFEDPRDARDACRGLDGRTVCGRRIRVEISTGKSRGGARGGYRNAYDSTGCYECGDKTHFARDCRRRRDRYRRRSRSGSRGRSVDRRSRSRSRSYSRGRNGSR